MAILVLRLFVNCYKEIKDYDVGFDYVFLASGTGTTQAGLVAGKLMYNGKEKIVGISIARKNPRGRHIVLDSISEYLTDKAISSEGIEEATNFVDDYIGGGYARQDEAVNAVIKKYFNQIRNTTRLYLYWKSVFMV